MAVEIRDEEGRNMPRGDEQSVKMIEIQKGVKRWPK